jgi:holo-[acyl-carrier protein] synthase
VIIGTGIDIIEVERVKHAISRHEGFKNKIFTGDEIKYCETKRNKYQNYAARYAAKEAFLKAMGIGWRYGAGFNEIEVVHDELGKPELVLHGKAKELADAKGDVRITVSLAHLRQIAVAIVILENTD